MDKQEAVKQLLVLLTDLESQRREKAALDRARTNLNSIQYSFRTKLD